MAIGDVLCLGGSLTVGDDGAVSGFRTFRGTLQTRLATAGYTLNFVGPNSLAAASGGDDAEHAGYVDHSIDSTGHATNNLTSKLSALKTDFPSPDLIIIDPPWWDIVNAPSSLASRYDTFIGAVQSGVWASVPILMCTAHPASGQTAAATAGVYAAFGLVNAQIETTRAAAPSTRFVADLAALTAGTTSAALTERALFFAQKAPDFQTTEGGKAVAAPLGGHLITSYKSIQDFNAQWTANVPRNPNGSLVFPPPGGTGLMDNNVQSVSGGVNRFLQAVAGVTPWYWIYAMPGHNASNTCVEVRNGFAAGKRIGGGWEFFFAGSRFGNVGQLWDGPLAAYDSNGNAYVPDSRSRSGQRSDGLTTWHAPRGNQGFEVWPEDTIPSRNVLSFHGGFNRDLMVNSECFWWGAQCRLALIDPNGPDDRPQARLGASCGADFFTNIGGKHYDRHGWPYNAMDGGKDAWARVDWQDWQMICAITIGREGSSDNGVHPEYHWQDPGTPGPLNGWSPPTPYNNPSTGYAFTASDVRANPLPIPPYWEGGTTSGGTGSGYLVNDYHLPSGGSRLYLLAQSGADKIAGVMSTAIVASGALAGFTGGGIVFEPMQGLATKPNVFAKLNGSSQINAEAKNRTTSQAPTWQTTTLPTAVVGSAYSGQLAASGDPAPTYSIVSGAPAWLSCSSAGALSGTPTGSATTHTVTFRATNSQGTADVVLSLPVVVGVAVTTTSLPNALQNVPYLQTLAAAGVEPFSWSIVSGSLPAGLALSGQVISGTPTAASGTASFTVRVTDALGRTDDQALSITNGVAGNVAVITTSSLPAGTVGVSYSQTIAATGTASISFAVVSGALPTGLSLNGSTGALTGTPTAAGAFGFTVRATNAFGFGDASFSVVINAVATAPVASPWGRFVRQ